MNRTALQVGLAAVAVVLAGCTGGVLTTGAQADTGTVDLYISDQPNAMDDFAHLNVTVTEVGFQQGGENGSWVERDVNDTTVDLTRLRGANATFLEEIDVPNGSYTKVFVHVGDVNGTLTAGEQVNVKLPSQKLHLNNDFAVGNGSEVDFVFDISVHKAGNSGKYILKPVVSQSGTEVPIDPVDEDADPDEAAADEGRDRSETAEQNGQADNKAKHNEQADENAETNGQAGNDAGNADLVVAVEGPVAAGENVTLDVTRNGSPVANAPVKIGGVTVGTTAADGTITVEVPDSGTLEVEIETGDHEVERTL